MLSCDVTPPTINRCECSCLLVRDEILSAINRSVIKTLVVVVVSLRRVLLAHENTVSCCCCSRDVCHHQLHELSQR